MIFDDPRPMLEWWIWDRADPTTWPDLEAVPITSYFWFFAFTGPFALISRIICWDWVEQGRSPKLIGIGVAVLAMIGSLTITLLSHPSDQPIKPPAFPPGAAR